MNAAPDAMTASAPTDAATPSVSRGRPPRRNTWCRNAAITLTATATGTQTRYGSVRVSPAAAEIATAPPPRTRAATWGLGASVRRTQPHASTTEAKPTASAVDPAPTSADSPISTASATAVPTASTRTRRGTADSSASEARRRSSAASVSCWACAARIDARVSGWVSGSTTAAVGGWSAGPSPGGGSVGTQPPGVRASSPAVTGASFHSSLRPSFGSFVVDGAGIPSGPEHERACQPPANGGSTSTVAPAGTARSRGDADPSTRKVATAATGSSAGCNATAAATTSATVDPPTTSEATPVAARAPAQYRTVTPRSLGRVVVTDPLFSPDGPPP